VCQGPGVLTFLKKEPYDGVEAKGGENMNIFSPKGFLLVGGAVLLVVGLLGFFGILIGPTPAQSIFGSAWYFDNAENLAHTVLGIAGLAAAFIFPAMWQKWLVILLGVVGVVVGIYSLLGQSMLLGANLENPADSILHLAVGAWALAAAFMVKK